MKKGTYISEELETKYWNYYKSQLESEKTRQTYWSDIVSFTDFVEKDLLMVTQSDVERYYQHHLHDSGIKLATLQKKFRELSAFSSYIVEVKEQTNDYQSYFENYFFPKLAELNDMVKMAKGHIPTIQEMDKILIAAQSNIMYYTLFSLIYRCALKPLEAIGLKAGDFIESDGQKYLHVGTKKKERVIPLPEDIVEILEAYNEQRDKNSLYYFYLKPQEQINERTLERHVQHLAKSLGISPITLYGMRDASIALMCASGASDAAISRDCDLTQGGIERYRGIVPYYKLQESAIHTVKIRILPADS